MLYEIRYEVVHGSTGQRLQLTRDSRQILPLKRYNEDIENRLIFNMNAILEEFRGIRRDNDGAIKARTIKFERYKI